ncbi:gamma-glutamylcyclotransferase [Candidatus Pacearchaeota archaeon]|nr:gamma-glutamylcyclotransferase [Candidatus Pacearchaeota archaeon]
MNYKIVGYGSLISHKSLRESIPDKHFVPVIVRGFKRVFNLGLEKGKDPDVLNVVKDKKHFFNGVLFDVNEKELKKIKEREDDYNLEQIGAYDFLTGKELCKCFILIDQFVGIDHKKKKPNKSYFILCREAAYHISREFGKIWDETTFVSTGKKVSQWIKKHRDYDTIG